MSVSPAAEPGPAAPWYRRSRPGENVYDLRELAGAFGDLGTLIPFVAGYAALTRVDPVGILLALGLGQLVAGLYYRTPMPVQPMKVIGGAAIASGGAVSPGTIFYAGVLTGGFWLLAGTTRTIERVTRLAAPPIVRGIVLGLAITLVAEGVRMMRAAPWLGAIGLGVTFVLLAARRLPAMFGLLVLGVLAAWVLEPLEARRVVLSFRPVLRIPDLAIGRAGWRDVVAGAALALPQLPLTLMNAVVAVRAENNLLFPDRPVSDRTLATSHGILNLVAASLGGVPLCHGAGGMAGHVRFGARTGGSLVMLGAVMIALSLFFGGPIGLLFQWFPRATLGVILFFTGVELAVTTRGVAGTTGDTYLTMAIAGMATWNTGAAFVAGVILHRALGRGWLKL